MRTKWLLPGAALAILIVVALVALVAWPRADRAAAPPPPTAHDAPAVASAPVVPVARPTAATPRPADTTSGQIDGQVLDADTRQGIANAEITFTGDAGVSTFQTSADGSFELAPSDAGSFELATVTAPGYLPYTPDRAPAGVRITLRRGQPVHGVVLLLRHAVDYRGLVVDARGTPVAGARVRVIASPASEPALVELSREWRTGPDGRFTFQAVEDSVLEATSGGLRGGAVVNHGVEAVHSLRIQLGAAPPFDATITGHVRDEHGAALAGAVIRGATSAFPGAQPTVFATSASDGSFVITGVDRAGWDLWADAASHVRGLVGNVRGGSRNVVLTLEAGLPLAGHVVDRHGAPVTAFTLVAVRHDAPRRLVETRPIVDPLGAFALKLAAGDYDLYANPHGSARGTPTTLAAGTTDARLVFSAGTTLTGRVIDRDDRTPVPYANITFDPPTSWTREDRGGTAARADGTFELTGITAGPLRLRVFARDYATQVLAPLTAEDDVPLGPLTIELGKGSERGVDLVGIGVRFLREGNGLRVTSVISPGGAFDAGVQVDDVILSIDGTPVAVLGTEGALARITGAVGSTVTLDLDRGGRPIQLVVERRLVRS
ncbi:MAG TPA: carboxypeptidase regulatory-like domain-containing protein [Kofleriaceae bacterium]|nr:carboxypeptidase regulatory-like domain-containing protein [Kofleriaceae bacterium]